MDQAGTCPKAFQEGNGFLEKSFWASMNNSIHILGEFLCPSLPFLVVPIVKVKKSQKKWL
jgi:hypothetical protein